MGFLGRPIQSQERDSDPPRYLQLRILRNPGILTQNWEEGPAQPWVCCHLQRAPELEARESRECQAPHPGRNNLTAPGIARPGSGSSQKDPGIPAAAKLPARAKGSLGCARGDPSCARHRECCAHSRFPWARKTWECWRESTNLPPISARQQKFKKKRHQERKESLLLSEYPSTGTEIVGYSKSLGIFKIPAELRLELARATSGPSLP